jgi:hypothetical protein
MGHLGHGDEQSQTTPKRVKFDFRDEQKKIKNVKRDVATDSIEDIEELLFQKSLLNFAQSNTSKNGTIE